MRVDKCFGIEVETDKIIDQYMRGVQERGLDDNMVKNPFKISIQKFPAGLWVLKVRPLYPNFTLFGWLTLFGAWFVFGFTYWLVIPLIIGLMGVFWSRQFFFLMTKAGLRKAGYKGPVKMLQDPEVIDRIAFKKVR